RVAAPASYGLGVLWGDYDGDGDQDIYVANDSQANFLFNNQGNGAFEEVGLLAGVALSEDGNAQAGMGAAFGDYDRDGDLDLFVTNFSDDYNTLYRNMGEGIFQDVSYAAQVGFSSRQHLGWGTHFADLDNDGWPDLFVANGHVYPQVDDFEIGTSYRQGKLVYRNRGDGSFEEVSGKWGPDLKKPSASRGAAFADFDQDGDIDIAVSNLDGRPQLFLNQGGNRSGGWISLKLQGVRSNRDAVGARVTLVTPSGRQLQEVQSGVSFQASNDLRLHFGLGKDDTVSELKVRWPSGEVQSFSGLKAGLRYRLKEGGQPEPEPLAASSHRKP
ncbi:MAG: CRTAC1 family protein, partial [Acidobacteriota bacterium]